MKKSLIATGLTAVAFAAMPALGVFADVTDTVILTINGSCSVGQTQGSPVQGGGVEVKEENAVNNQLYTWDADGSQGGTLKVTCNDASGWNVKAVGSSTGTPVTSMAASNSGTPIVTGTAESGATSNWMFKVAGTGTVAGYQSWSAIPATATKVATGSTAVSEGAISTGYQVWVSATQQADTYTGKVT
ncbi:hypothetical protein ACQUWZ_26735, partial [Ralstonia pseudosolanacearum]|uniref:hypothetical protein n=1 Tax=Ralstonia pseudosolanacearum TaxID=1310165 RepID=UPI003D183D68